MDSQGEDPALTLRVEHALEDAGVSTDRSKTIAATLLGNEVFKKIASESAESRDSGFFDFRGKVHDTVRRFAADGLTTQQYLAAAVKQPQLFSQSPQTIERNIRGVVEPFVADGLTIEKYVAAAVKQPQLFYHAPETIERNIRGVVERFAGEGLTAQQYLAAAVKQPPLFYRSPETIERNIRGVAERFAADGLTAQQYLAAVVKQPSLFCQSPATISGHIHVIADAYRKEIVRFAGKSQCDSVSLKPVLDFLCTNPKILALATDNLQLRAVNGALEDVPPTASRAYKKSRSQAERGVAKHLGHADLNEPVLPVTRMEDGSVNPADANRWVLRALIHSGMIKSGTLVAGKGQAKE